METKKTTIYLNEDLHEKTKLKAAEQGMSWNQYITKKIEQPESNEGINFNTLKILSKIYYWQRRLNNKVMTFSEWLHPDNAADRMLPNCQIIYDSKLQIHNMIDSENNKNIHKIVDDLTFKNGRMIPVYAEIKDFEIFLHEYSYGEEESKSDFEVLFVSFAENKMIRIGKNGWSLEENFVQNEITDIEKAKITLQQAGYKINKKD